MSMRNRKSTRISSNELLRSTESAFRKNFYSVPTSSLSYTVFVSSTHGTYIILVWDGGFGYIPIEA